MVACLVAALLFVSAGCLGVADETAEDGGPQTGLDALADGSGGEAATASGDETSGETPPNEETDGETPSGDEAGGEGPSPSTIGAGTEGASSGPPVDDSVTAVPSPKGPAPPTVIVRWIRRGTLLPGVDGADPVRAPKDGEFVVANVTIRRDDGLADPRPVSAALLAGDDRYRLADVAHPRALDDGLVLEPDAAASGWLVFAVPADATPDALGVAVGDVTAESTRRLPVRRVGSLGHDAARLAIVGHELYTSETLASTYGVEEILPRLQNTGDLPAHVTRVELVLGEERASCSADTTVPPGGHRTVTMDCRWRDMAPGDEPEVDPGSYDVRVTVFENGTVTASRTLNVTVPAE
jgi:hypothetical protein